MRGGARPGAGRKPKADKRVHISLYLAPATCERISKLRETNPNITSDIAKYIDKYIDKIVLEEML